MSDAFEPLAFPFAAATEPAFAPFSLKLLKGNAAVSPVIEFPKPASVPPPPAPPLACAPTVTLQRSGDIVTSVHIQCACGQVIELNCVYGESIIK